MTNTIKSVVQSFSPGKLVELFIIDLTNVGGGPTYWTNSSSDTQGAITFNGNVYLPRAIRADGFEKSTQGSLPQPTLETFADAALRAAMITYKDFIGGKLTRIKTFSRFLDGEPDADPDQIFPKEVWIFEQKMEAHKSSVKWRLSSILEQDGILLPKRVYLKETCILKYRQYVDGDFVYVPEIDGGCPYAGTNYFDANGNVTTIDKDVCGHTLPECKRRFGERNLLYFMAFPGLKDSD